MSNNNPQRTSPRFFSSTTHIPNDPSIRNSPTVKLNIMYSSSAQNSDSVTSAAAILSQGDLNTLNPNALQFYLQKLDLLYQNLNVRVHKLEQLFHADITNTINNNNFNIMAQTIDINNDVGQFEFNPSNCSINSSSSTHSFILEQNQKEISVIT